MVCPTCGLDNDPSAAACARCNTALVAAPAWPPPGYTPTAPPPGYTPQPGYPPQPGYGDAGPPAPGYPAPPSGPPVYGRPPRNWLPLVAGISVVVLIALVAGLVLYRNGQDDPVAGPAPATQTTTTVTTTGTTTGTTDSTTAPPTTTTAADPLPQARVVDDVLVRSKASRDKLNSAIDRVGRCTGLSGALADMRAVGDERRTQIDEVRNADLSAVGNGESIRSTLVTALQHSLDADAAFVEWAAAAVNNGCADTTGRKAAYNRGLAESEQAGTSKVAFLAVWNPVAGQLGLPTRTRQGI
ncbi:hypothetical protein ACQPZJ_16735 [Actinoplanes sp. CA-054009]